MTQDLIAPVVLPAVLAALMPLALGGNLRQQRWVSGLGLVALWLIALRLLLMADLGGVEVYRLGNWPAPFGIVLVLDRLSALMLLLTASLALPVALYAMATGWDTRGRHFHALFQFQMMGLNGAFLTGDAFNLFVFFEVLLIASYGLMIHSGGAERLRAGLHYVAVNLVGSALFLVALGTLYAVTGTLNMADLARRAAALPAGDAALLRVAAVLMLVVFGLKSALVPLQFWLPGTYAQAPGPVAALFAIMTKVGAYAILRMVTLVFGPTVPATLGIGGWLLPLALLTMALGATASVGARTLPGLAAFATIGSMGSVLAAFGLLTPAGVAAGLYYLIHSTLAAAALFLIADLVTALRGNARLAPGLGATGALGVLFGLAALGMAGMPPLPGFIGKLLLLEAALQSPQVWLIWAVVLGFSLVGVVAFARAGSVLFWQAGPEPALAPARLPVVLACVPLALMVALSLFARPVLDYLAATAAQLSDTAGMIAAVLAPGS